MRLVIGIHTIDTDTDVRFHASIATKRTMSPARRDTRSKSNAKVLHVLIFPQFVLTKT